MNGSNTIVFLSLFFFSSLLSHQYLQARELLCSLVSTESDPDAFIENCINVINGDYCEAVTDIEIKGPDILRLQRFYNSRDYVTGNHEGGWRIFPQRLLVVGKDLSVKPRTIGKETFHWAVAFAGERSGGFLPYCGWRSNGGSTKDPLEIDILEHAHGVVNTFSKDISGQSNRRNNLLQCKNETCELALGDGSRRLFKRVGKIASSMWGEEFVSDLAALVEEPEYFLLIQETLPSGNVICFSYDAGHLAKVELKNSSLQRTLSWMQFSYEIQDNHIGIVKVSTSDEKTVEYRFTGQLQRVEGSHLIPCTYEYHASRLTKKILPEGRFVEVEYEKFGKVRALKKPNATTGMSEASYAFSYGESYTEVCNALGIKTSYSFDKRKQLTAIDQYGREGKLYRKDRKIWGKGKNESGLLFATAIEDESAHVLSCRAYTYDDRCNVIEERLYGNLTGKDEVVLAVTPEGTLINPDQEECHVRRYEYSKDGFNLLVLQGDSKGNKTTFQYKPGTNLLIRKFIYEKDNVKKRTFHTYDENAVMIKTIEDDGFASEEKNTVGVQERRITVHKPKETLPGLGLAETVEERGFNIKENKEFLLKKVVNEFDSQGNIITSHLYDSNDTYRCSEARSYNPLGKITSTTDAMGREFSYSYDLLGNKISESIPHENKIITYVYDFRNQYKVKKEHSNELDLVSCSTYDLLGRETAATDYFGNTILYDYDFSGRLIKVAHPEVFDENHQILRPTFAYSYDIFGNVIQIVDPKGYITRRAYNLRGDATKIFYPDGTSELFKYDTEGSLHRSLSRDLIVTVYEYDYLGRCTYEEISTMALKGSAAFINGRRHNYNAFRLLSNESGSHKETFRFDSSGRTIAKALHDSYENDRNPKASLTEIVYDPLSRISQKKIWFGAGSEDFTLECFERNFAGNLLEKRIEDARGKVLYRKAYSFDLSDRCVEERGFDHGEVYVLSTSSYNSQGQLIFTRDALGDETQVLIDYSFRNSIGQNVLKTTHIDPMGDQTEIEYDVLSRVVKICKRDLNGILLSSQEIIYDLLGNKCSEIHQVIANGLAVESKVLRWMYGPMGRLEEVIEAFGTPAEKKTTYSYNTLGQLSSLFVQGNVAPVTYSYDNAGNLSKIEYSEGKNKKIHNTYSYDKHGNILIAKALNDISVERTYDVFNQPLTETVSDGEGKYTISYAYDRRGRPKEITLPDKSKIAYHFDALYGRKVERLSAHGQVLYSHSYDEYDEQGRLLLETLIGYVGNQVHAYDPTGHRVATKNDFGEEEYTYDPRGRVIEIIKDGVKNSTFYSALSQLTSEKNKFYDYNSLNDRIGSDAGKYLYNARNQLLESPNGSFSYDPQGNLLRKVMDGEESQYEFSILSQLISFKKSDNTTCSFVRDAFGRLLVKKKFNSQDKQIKPTSTTRYLNLGYHEIGTLSKNAIIETLKVPGLHLGELSLESIAFEIRGECYAPLHSMSGHVVAVLDPKKAQVLEKYSYSSFGEETILNALGEQESVSRLGIPWRYAEKRFCEDLGLIDFGLRYYDPTIGRWISPDPIGFNDGPNTYAYLHNNPLAYLDRFGLAAEDKAPVIDLKYLYGEVEDHCFCEKHRTCKKGGDIGKSDSPYLPKITYDDGFEDRMVQLNPQAARSTVFDLSSEGRPELPADMQIGFINGIMNTMDKAIQSARYISALAGGYNIHAVYNASHGLRWDLYESKLGLDFIATEPVRQLHKMWNSYFEKSSSNAKFLMICHSQGAILTRNALLDYPPELRKRILVVAIAPGGYIYRESCARVVHYRVPFYRDGVPQIDCKGKVREAATTYELTSHGDAERWDHGFLSPTYMEWLTERIQNFINSSGREM